MLTIVAVAQIFAFGTEIRPRTLETLQDPLEARGAYFRWLIRVVLEPVPRLGTPFGEGLVLKIALARAERTRSKGLLDCALDLGASRLNHLSQGAQLQACRALVILPISQTGS